MIRVFPSDAVRRAALEPRCPLQGTGATLLVWGYGLTATTRREALRQRAARSSAGMFSADSDGILDAIADALADVIADQLAHEYLQSIGALA